MVMETTTTYRDTLNATAEKVEARRFKLDQHPMAERFRLAITALGKCDAEAQADHLRQALRADNHRQAEAYVANAIWEIRAGDPRRIVTDYLFDAWTAWEGATR